MGEQSGQVVGYARVSSSGQNLDRQISALGKVDRLFEEKASAKDRKGRPVLTEALTYVRQGDILRVKSPDRLARSTQDLLNIVEELDAKGVRVEFVDQPSLNTGTTHGKFTLTVLGAVAEMERSLIHERQVEGIALAKARGAYAKAPRLSEEQIEQARELANTGVPKAKIARDMKISRTTLHHALAGTGSYSTNSSSPS